MADVSNHSAAVEQPGNEASRDRRRAAVALFACWLIVSTAGAVFINRFWSAHQQPDIGARRSCVFVLAMTAACVLGYRLYRSQSRRVDPAAVAMSWRAYRAALKTAIILQCIILLLGALTLDMGETFHITFVAAIAYWPMAVLIVYRRPTSPSAVDLAAIRWGYLFILLAVASVGPPVWAQFGR